MRGGDDPMGRPGADGAVRCCRAVVVNFEAGGALVRAVSSLLRSPRVHRVVVVDNASADDSLARLDEGGFDPVRVVVEHNTANLGFARACNQGIALGDEGDDVLLFNPDGVAHDGAVEALCAALAADPRAGAAGPLLLDPDGSEQAGGRRSAPTPWRSFVRAFGLTRLRSLAPRHFAGYGLEDEPLPSGPVAVDALSGACMLVRREALDAVGGLDEGYFLHCEDLDLGEQLRRAGWRSLFVPAARVTHDKGGCSRSRPLMVEWHKHRGMWRYYRKFQSPAHGLSMRALVATGICLRFAAVAVVTVARTAARRCRGGGAS